MGGRSVSGRVIVTGMFRSGTTHLWRLLSADPAFEVSYCEPLHPRLDQEMLTWEHYRSYQARADLIKRYWMPDFSSNKLFLKPEDLYPELKMYLEKLLTPKSLAKFVRLNLRLGWFATSFPDVFIVFIVRDPRGVCFSMLHHPDQEAIIRHDLPWEDWHARQYFDLYSQIPLYHQYLSSLKDEPPYVKIMALWSINIEKSLCDLQACARHWIVVRYEDLCNQPERELRKIYTAMESELPTEVLCSVNATVGTERPWQRPTNSTRVDLHKQVPDRIWRNGVRKAKIEATMKKLGYEV